MRILISIQKRQHAYIFGMITKTTNTKVTNQESINADKFEDYLNILTLEMPKKTFIALDKVTIHRNRKVIEQSSIWGRKE